MKFERKHRTTKQFVTNSNFHNVAKSVAEKYKYNIKLENSALWSMKNTPICASDIEIQQNLDGSVNSIDFCGILIKNCQETCLMTNKKKIF